MKNQKVMTQKAFLQWCGQFQNVKVYRHEEYNCDGVCKMLLAYDENEVHFATYTKNDKTARSVKEF